MKVTVFAVGEEKDFQVLCQAPPSMTSRMNIESRELVEERYKTRFELAAQPCDPEPICSPAAVHVPPACSEFLTTLHSACPQAETLCTTASEKLAKILELSNKIALSLHLSDVY
jgi:hypothetical protein